MTHPSPFTTDPFMPTAPTIFPSSLEDEDLLRETVANGYYGNPLVEQLARRLELALETVEDSGNLEKEVRDLEMTISEIEFDMEGRLREIEDLKAELAAARG